MKLFCIVLFMYVFISGLTCAQSSNAQDLAPKSEGPAIINGDGGEPQYEGPSAVLWDQSELVNDPGGGLGGADRSFVESTLGHTLYGWGHQVSASASIADDFIIPAGESWQIDMMTTFAYQTGAPTTSTITEVRIQIWDGNPMSGGVVIWGDLTTNRMTNTTWSNIYRTSDTAPTASDRAIMVQTSTIGTTLGEGHYWVQWQSNGTLASGPWCPPRTILGMAVTGDALAFQGGVWGQALNGTSPNGAPFILSGTAITIPVELTSFSANTNNGLVVLNWETATEINNRGFEVERRTENSEYKTITFVEGHGTTAEPQSYSYIDQSAEQGINYYRLKQVDLSGTYSYSPEVEINVAGPLTFNLEQNYPNPFNPLTTIKYSIPSSGFVTLKVYNVLGSEVARLVSEEKPAGSYEINFNASQLSSGIYYYTISSGGFVETKKMVLMK